MAQNISSLPKQDADLLVNGRSREKMQALTVCILDARSECREDG